VADLPDISYRFSDSALLKLALSHRSSGRDNNERLELLGDSILGFIIAEFLYRQFPEASEGELSRLRAELVKKSTLAEIARELNLGQMLILGEGEKKSGGDNRESILADSLEALVSAIYLDSELYSCRTEVLLWFTSRLKALGSGSNLASKDAKTRLQEFLQAQRLDLPEYELSALTGKDHEQEFTVKCKISILDSAVTGRGTSRREAEQQAAAAALEKLNL
jgi:ribonuclease-3